MLGGKSGQKKAGSEKILFHSQPHDISWHLFIHSITESICKSSCSFIVFCQTQSKGTVAFKPLILPD